MLASLMEVLRRRDWFAWAVVDWWKGLSAKRRRRRCKRHPEERWPTSPPRKFT
jgi:hypothetical protein